MSFRKYARLVKNNFSLKPRTVIFLIHHALTLYLFNNETKKQFSENYGDFHRGRDLRDYRLSNPGAEGGAILGEVVYFASTVKLGERKVLFAGDRNDVKPIWSRYFPIDQMVTCGMHDMEHYWNFENPPPASLSNIKFGLILSQAMLEHIIDPFRHFSDLASLLDEGGELIINTVVPGFFYHRVPIDCFRFYPDWFETVASRLGLIVVEKQICVFNITYKFKKPLTQ